ncbi:DUF192 domain-containing protein [Thermotoga sp. KOL6]|uniref:DUF192 domain-containing protein n=1 Tax=Thermotoga sp. KOL6 TaxID=126741 RepID=UPI000C77815D|nr:DUF192 domain-containing protein [Thermotoga sp. KOL6]
MRPLSPNKQKKIKKIVLPILIIIGITVIVVATGRKEGIRFPKGKIVITNERKSLELNVEIANTPFLRSVGFMYRKSIPNDLGMLFIFDENTRSGFWMKNTHVPLEIAFIDEDGIIFSVQEMEPCEEEPCKIYYAPKPFRYALEVKKGFFEKYGFGVGSKVFIEH